MTTSSGNRTRRPRRWRTLTLLVTAPMLAGSVGAGCSTSTSTSTKQASKRTTAVNVLYAGSLVGAIANQIGPAFHAATGDSLDGVAGGSTALAAQIRGETRQGDVFVSAAPAVNQTLQGSAAGNWVSWYATFATSKLVLGYNPKSRFAQELRTTPWDQVVSQPGFLLGRTDPAADPKGVLAVQALTQAAAEHSQPGLAALTTSTAEVYPEETLVGRLQAGQIDAGFFYAVEAKAASIPTVPLTGTSLAAIYTITVLNRAPHPGGADAFVSFLFAAKGRASLVRAGLVPIDPPTVVGDRGSVPASLRMAILPG